MSLARNDKSTWGHRGQNNKGLGERSWNGEEGNAIGGAK
jgi:hypothetical protein